LETARDWGRVVFVGEGGTVTFEPSPLLLHKQLTLMGSWVTGIAEMGELLQFLARKALHPEAIVTNRYALADAGQAYRAFDSGTPGKTVIVWQE
jgi:threonine dehydrogenase-like Zn-dependent dehydrogenase